MKTGFQLFLADIFKLLGFNAVNSGFHYYCIAVKVN